MSDDDVAARQRAAIREVMRVHGLRPSPWAKRAGVSSGSLYAFLDERTQSMSLPVLQKLASVVPVPLSALTGEDEPSQADAPITHAVRGDAVVRLGRPPRRRAPMPRDVVPDTMAVGEVAVGMGAALREGALLYWPASPLAPEAAAGKLCVVTLADDGAQVLADLRRGFGDGAWMLVTPAGRVVEGARVAGASPVEWIRPA